MEAHEGSISVASAGTGRGTDVTLRLPLVSAFEDAAHPVAGRGLPDLSGVRILVVEDTDDSLEALSVTLERLGAHVLAARDGVEALDVMAARPVDLVLCDLRMPRMDGFEFLRELHRMQGRTHVPVIAVSGLAGGADHERTEAAGFEGHVDKPFDDEHLLAAVGAAIARRPIYDISNSLTLVSQKPLAADAILMLRSTPLKQSGGPESPGRGFPRASNAGETVVWNRHG